MARWPDIADWRGPTPNTSGSIIDHMYVVVHTADGSYEGTISWQKNPSAKVSSHFVVAKDGRIAQMLDTNAKAWTQINGNPYSISIENEGNENTPLTDAQLTANAKILAKAHQVHGVPLQLTGKVGVRGLGHHSMGAESSVNWGHSLCPGNIIKAQKPEILARAIAIVGGAQPSSTPTSSRGDDMLYTVKSGGDRTGAPAGSDPGAVYAESADGPRWITGEEWGSIGSQKPMVCASYARIVELCPPRPAAVPVQLTPTPEQWASLTAAILDKVGSAAGAALSPAKLKARTLEAFREIGANIPPAS